MCTHVQRAISNDHHRSSINRVVNEGGTVVRTSGQRKESEPGWHSRESISTRVISTLLVATSNVRSVKKVAELHHVTSEEMLAPLPTRVLFNTVGGDAVVVQCVGHDFLKDGRSNFSARRCRWWGRSITTIMERTGSLDRSKAHETGVVVPRQERVTTGIGNLAVPVFPATLYPGIMANVPVPLQHQPAEAF